jgi:hypothetical protein
MKRFLLSIMLSMSLLSCSNNTTNTVEEPVKIEKETYDSIRKEIFDKQVKDGFPAFLVSFLPQDASFMVLNDNSWKITKVTKINDNKFDFSTRLYILSKTDISKSNFYDFYGSYDVKNKTIVLNHIYSDWYPFVSQKEKVKLTAENTIPLLSSIEEVKLFKDIKVNNLSDAEIRYKYTSEGLAQTDYSITLDVKDSTDKLVNLKVKVVEIKDQLDLANIKSVDSNDIKNLWSNEKYKGLF